MSGGQETIQDARLIRLEEAFEKRIPENPASEEGLKLEIDRLEYGNPQMDSPFGTLKSLSEKLAKRADVVIPDLAPIRPILNFDLPPKIKFNLKSWLKTLIDKLP